MIAAEMAARFQAKRSGNTFRGNCPACGYREAFTIRSARDGSALVHCMNGCHRDDLAPVLARVAGGAWTPPEAPPEADVAAAREKRQVAAVRLLDSTVAARGTLAEVYLTGRGLPDLTGSAALRFRGDTSHPEGGRHPAMVAAVVDVQGQVIGCHRTYLARDGQGKADITPAKASLGPIWGGAIRLADHDPAQPLVVGEGIETSASAGRLMGLPAWAAISAGNLGKGLILPPAVRHVVIAADPDAPGQLAASQAAERWQREGRKVQIARPRGTGDFNDLLKAEGGNHA